jgi:hypothetical protein
MKEVPYSEFRALVSCNGSMRALHNSDARVGGISMRQALEMSAACDRWLASRGLRTRSVWWDSQMQKRKKK